MSRMAKALQLAPIVALLLSALAAPSLAARVDLKVEAAASRDGLEFRGRSLLQMYGTPAATFPDLPSALGNLSTMGFQTLVGALNTTNLTSQLTGNYIILAPTDQAFQNLLQQNNTILNDQTVVTEILQYHVIPTAAMNQQLNTTSQLVLPTLLAPGTFMNASSNITIKNVSLGQDESMGQDDLPYYAGGMPFGAYVNWTNYVFAGGSTIYPIDQVLVPPAKELLGQNYPLTILEAAQGSPDLSTLVTLAASEPDVLALVSDPDTAVTVLAPSNTAFQNALTALNLTLDQVQGSPLLRRVLLNHVLIVPLPIAFFQPNNETMVPTLATYENATDVVNVTSTGNAADGSNGVVATVVGAGNMAAGMAPINVTAADILAGKSSIWLIDGVILPAIDLSTVGNYTAPPPSNSTPSPPPGVVAPPPPGFIVPGVPNPGSNGQNSPPPPPSAASLPAASLLMSAAAGMLALLALV